MTATPALTTDLKREVLALEDDLRARLESITENDEQGRTPREVWHDAHRDALSHGRTSASWVAWRDDRITQAAVGWVLTTVFVRFCEDNALVAPVWITGPSQRRQEALDAELAFYRERSARGEDVTTREWLQQSIAHLASLPSTAALVDSHAALHLLSPSGDAAEKLVAFWRRRDDAGALRHDLTDPTLSTRFLGNLYQELSEHAKATYALLQTPVFVEEFILDRTLEPALDERPLEGFRMIDPTCGSGHFLLGAFDRLLDRWQREAPGLEKQSMVQEALNAVHGVDLNPFAVAIARFRLTVAALQACGSPSLTDAPGFRFHLAVGDSLLHGPGQQTLEGDADLRGFTYATEDLGMLQVILTEGCYDCVVGNPPYITETDPSLRRAYKERYRSCSGQWTLAIPFMERFFGLAKPASGDHRAGWIGQITSNAFMKRSFGKRLVQDFLTRHDVQQVCDSEGAWIAGHNMDGTPTVILVGRNAKPVEPMIRTVLSLGKRELRPTTSDAGPGPYWQSMVERIDEPGWSNEWIEIVDLPRVTMSTHPWSFAGGAAGPLRQSLKSMPARVAERVSRCGMFGDSHAEDLFAAATGSLLRLGVKATDILPSIPGDAVRDWVAETDGELFLPSGPIDHPTILGDTAKALWPWRTWAWARASFTGGSYRENGKSWLAWHQLSVSDRTASHLIFAKIASHNHFALSGESPAAEKPSALRVEGNHDLDALLGVLNSSVACFWMRDVAQPKGGSAEIAWSRTFEFGANVVLGLPLPVETRSPTMRSLMLRMESTKSRWQYDTEGLIAPSPSSLSAERAEYEEVRGEMIALQEELDWEVYRLYGLLTSDEGAELISKGESLQPLTLGQRAFEISLARQAAAGDEQSAWFVRHGSNPVVELPTHWPADYRDLVQRRLDLMASDPSIQLLERPEHKRRWESEPWDKRQERSLRGWLLGRLESRRFWFDAQGRPTPRSVAQLADDVARDADLVSVLALWEGRPDVPLTQSLVRLLADEAVPYVAAHRYKDIGLRKREAWEITWALQRREDAGERLTAPIPVPPKYSDKDFLKKSYWQARGKLDVPKERFILYPDAGRETDPTPLLGWAGWDHAQQALALNLVIAAREDDGWSEDRLVPLVAGLAELQPWVQQWHDEVDPDFDVNLADYYAEQLNQRAAQVGHSLTELAAWRPAPPTRGRKKKTT